MDFDREGLSPEEKELESFLQAAKPKHQPLNRDALMFECGRGAGRQASSRQLREVNRWKVLCGLSSAACLLLFAFQVFELGQNSSGATSEADSRSVDFAIGFPIGETAKPNKKLRMFMLQDSFAVINEASSSGSVVEQTFIEQSRVPNMMSWDLENRGL